jgi:hypothetical protein
VKLFETAFLRLRRRYCADTIAAEVAALPPSAWIPHPGKLPGNDAVPLITPGGQITNAFTGPMAPTEHLRRCSYIMEIMADLGGVWGRSRIMGLAAGADVPAHVDINYYWRTHLRIHIPIITSPRVLFTCGEETVHMEAGECWLFDSFRMHNVRNGGTAKRLHLVIDTVGSEKMWDLVEEAKADPAAPLPPPLPRGTARGDALAFEQVNAPTIMSPWELRCHVDFVMQQLPPAPLREPIARSLERFAHSWAAAWAQFGPAEAGLPSYRRLIERVQAEVRRLGGDKLLLPNQVPVERALGELIFAMAAPAPARPQALRPPAMSIPAVPARRLAS